MAAPAKRVVQATLDKNSLLYKFKRWCYYKSYFPEIGLRRDDIWMETETNMDIMKEALRRLPQQELDARNFRIMRANQLSMEKTVLPKELWTDFDEDKPYLIPIMDEVKKEFEERKRWDSM